MTCPIAGYKIDENAARLVAAFVVAAIVVSLFGSELVRLGAYAFLALDFGARAFSRPKWSLLGRIASRLLQGLRVVPRLVDAGPKRFAARIGLGFSLALLLLEILGAGLAVQVLGGMLAICAFLEAAFGYCLGCRIHGLWFDLRDRLHFLPTFTN